jgi:predicted lipoprotein with Yx(FWY)xxD motif
MCKTKCLAALVWLFSSAAFAQNLKDAPVPAAISLVQENGSLNFNDDNGQSLYVSDRDTADHSTCDGQCATMWPPVAAPKDSHQIGDWTPIRRSDNSLQWAYKGKPVYTYKGDTAPGQTKGAGLGGVWHVLTP